LKGSKATVILLIIFLLPLFFYLLVKEGTHRYRFPEYYGPKHLNTAGTDTVYHTIADFSATDLNKNEVTFEKYNPSYWVFQFFNTGCKEPCTDVFYNLNSLIQDFSEAPKVKFVSISTHPLLDIADSLTALKNKIRITSPQWYLCTEDSMTTDKLMRESFFLHGNLNDAALNSVFLVDSYRHLRGIYDGADPMEMRRLKDDIKMLSYETKQKEKK
jgi:protein SCO1/2